MKNLLYELRHRQLGLAPACTSFPLHCRKFLCLSRLFRPNSNGEDPEKSSVILGFVHSPNGYPLLGALWYTQMSWVANCVRLVLFDFLYLRSAVMAIPLKRGIDCQLEQFEILQWPNLSNFCLIKVNDDQLCLVSLPDLADCNMCRQFSRAFHFHKFCLKFPLFKTDSRQQVKAHLYPWSPSSPSTPFYDVVLTTSDTLNSSLQIASLFRTNCQDFLEISDLITEEGPDKRVARKFVDLMTSMVVFMRQADFSRAKLPKSCSHVRELQLPQIHTETMEDNLVPACHECFVNFLRVNDSDKEKFDVLLVRQANLFFRTVGNCCCDLKYNKTPNFGISVDGDCLLLAKFGPCCLAKNSHAFIFNLLTYQFDCVIESQRGLSLCPPPSTSLLQSEPHSMSNLAYLAGKSLQKIEDATRRFVIVNDTVMAKDPSISSSSSSSSSSASVSLPPSPFSSSSSSSLPSL